MIMFSMLFLERQTCSGDEQRTSTLAPGCPTPHGWDQTPAYPARTEGPALKNGSFKMASFRMMYDLLSSVVDPDLVGS
jgi:hypothetical protein